MTKCTLNVNEKNVNTVTNYPHTVCILKSFISIEIFQKTVNSF